MIKKLNYRFWKRVVSSTYINIKSLSAFRIVLGVFLLVFYLPNFSWIGDVPPKFYSPPLLSIANLFNNFPTKEFFLILDSLVLLSLGCLTLGVKARIATLVYLITCLVGFNFQYSFGKIDHNILIYALLGCMAFSGWGRHLAVVPDKKSKIDNTSKSLSLLGVLICFGMFTAGFEKALNWIDFDLSLNGFLRWSQSGIFNAHRDSLLALYVKYFPPFLLEILDYSAVIFELSPLLFLLYSRKGWRIWLLIACTFHFANTLFLNIPFVIQSLVYLVFIDFTWLYKKLKKILSHFYLRWIAVGTVIFIVVVRFIDTIVEPINFVFLTSNELAQLKLYFGLVVWTLAILLIIGNISGIHREGRFESNYPNY